MIVVKYRPKPVLSGTGNVALVKSKLDPEAITVTDLIDVFRVCAVFKKPYASRYVWEALRWHYVRPIEITHAALQTLYRNSQRTTLRNDQMQYELCPFCMATGLGAILCRCGTVYCYGRTTLKGRSFGCPSCGNAGMTVPALKSHQAALPGGGQ